MCVVRRNRPRALTNWRGGGADVSGVGSRAIFAEPRVPGAAQHVVVRCRPGTVRTCGGPGPAVHHVAALVLHRIRDTGHSSDAASLSCPAQAGHPVVTAVVHSGRTGSPAFAGDDSGGGVLARAQFSPSHLSRAQRSTRVMRCRPGTVGTCGGPGPAAHHVAALVLHRIRDTGHSSDAASLSCPAQAGHPSSLLLCIRACPEYRITRFRA